MMNLIIAVIGYMYKRRRSMKKKKGKRKQLCDSVWSKVVGGYSKPSSICLSP